MEIHARRQHVIQDQENVYAAKGKGAAPLPMKRQGLAVRGALGDMNTNVQNQRNTNVGKVAVAAAEFEKKSQNRAPLRSNYGHVQSKIDTGLAHKPTSRPTLRREESTACLAVKAAAQIRRVPLKDTASNTLNNAESKQSARALLQGKENKQTAKLPTVKERIREKEANTLKSIIKDPSDCLGRLRLIEIRSHASDSDLSSVSLPNGIEDIDDDNGPLSMSNYVKDIFKYLTDLEELFPIEQDYLAKHLYVTGKMRGTLIDWLVEVYQQFNLILETFQLCVGIIDRYLQVVPNVKRNRLQLIGTTALYIASKYEEIYSPNIEDFVIVADQTYTKAEFFECEREILTKLGFCLAKPIPLSFLRRFIKAAHGDPKVHNLSKYFIDLCLVEYSMAHYRPSELAAAAVCLSQYVLSSSSAKFGDKWTPTLKYYTRYGLEHIAPIVRKMALIVVNADKAKNKAVYKEYLSKSLGKASIFPKLKEDRIYELAGIIREVPSSDW